MDIFKDIHAKLEITLKDLKKQGVIPQDIDISKATMEPPRDSSHGDMASNAAMVLAKKSLMKPRDLAEKIAEKMQQFDEILSVEIAGPGFINLTIDNDLWRAQLRDIIKSGINYGDSDLGKNIKVNIEYVSANPTGPLHIGHARGAVFGDILSSLLKKTGYDICTEYYVNDAGAQIDILAQSLYLRYQQAHGEDIGAIPEGLYPGEYLISLAGDMKSQYGGKFLNMQYDDYLPEIRKIAIDAMLILIKDDLAALGIKQDIFTSEQSLVDSGMVDEVLQNLKTRGLIYDGVLAAPKGKLDEDWQPREQELFKATKFGDDVDRPLRKSDGSWTYFASDIAYHLDKYKRGFAVQIDVWGADHSGYVKRMQSATTAISQGNAALNVKICQMVKLMDKGKPIKMSKRSGNFVTLRHLVDAVGKDVVRFFLLTRKNDAPMDFDLTVVKEQSRDNPVFYVQYAHARCFSVIKQAIEAFPNMVIDQDSLANANIERLNDAAEINLIKIMAGWPRLVEAAAKAQEPHRIAFYLQELAAAFHGLWTKGKTNSQLRFIIDDDYEITQARMALILGFRQVVASGLHVFGVEPMRELH